MWEGQKWEDEGMWEGQKWEWEAAEGGNMRLLVMDAPTELSQVDLIKLSFITNSLFEHTVFFIQKDDKRNTIPQSKFKVNSYPRNPIVSQFMLKECQIRSIRS